MQLSPLKSAYLIKHDFIRIFQAHRTLVPLSLFMHSVKLLGRKDPAPFPQHAALPNRFHAPLRPRLLRTAYWLPCGELSARSLLFAEVIPSVPLSTAEPTFKPLIYIKFTFTKSTFSRGRKTRRKIPKIHPRHRVSYHHILRESQTQEFVDLSPRDVYRAKLRW